MSTTIDEKVVEMRFDNKQFEAGVATSLNTLDRLKKGLDLEGAAKGFDSLSNAASKIDMSSLGSAAEVVSSKFSALETIAVGALLKIGSQAVTTGEQLLKSLTIDQITEGWSKYSDKTTAVQTIMSATGKSIDEVNGSLEKLIWFTDETSYSMTDMTSNIGKFTSQGVDLDTAVTAMEGISTWASLSGGSINEASRAMYNLSQALGVGAVKLQDWKSIENANMATKEFKEMAMEAAVATGDLTKSFDAAGNAIYKTSKGTEVTAANFSSTLSDAWFTSDALMGVLNNYGTYADGIYELYNNLGEGVEKTTSEIIADMKSLRGADDQTILSAGYTEDQIDLVRRLSEEVGSIGQKSFAAAQEAKTFEEVITSVKEAVASGWSQTFETVFGNYEQAKVLWTDMANALYEVFAEGGNARNELLSEALSISGFDRFKSVLMETGVEMGAFQEKLSEIADGKGISLDRAIAEYGSLEAAVQNGVISADMLREAANNCAEELEDVDLSDLNKSIDEVVDGIDELSGRQHLISAFWNTWEGVGALLSTVKDAFREIFPAATAEQVYNFAKGLNELTTRFKEFLTDSEEGQKLLTDLKNTFQGVFAVLDIVKQAFSGLWRALAPARSEVGGLLTNILGLTGSFGEWLTNLDKAIKENDTFYNAFKKVVDFISGAITTVKNFGTAIGEWLNLPSFSEATESIKSFMAVVKEKIGAPGLEFLRNLFAGLCTRAKQVKDAIVTMKDSIVDSMDKADRAVSGNKLVQVLTGVWNLVKSVASAVSGLLGKAFDGLINSLSNADFNGILDFLNALAAGGLIAALKKFLDPMNEMKDTFGSFIDWVKGIGGGINKILDGVRGSLEAWQTKLKADALGKIAAAVAVLSVSLLILASIDSEKITVSLAAITTLFIELSGAMAVLDKLNLDSKSLNKSATAMIKMGAALLILSFAVKNLGELEPEQLAKGLVGVGVLLAEIAAFLKVAEFNKGATKTATGMVIFAAAIKILASAVKDLAGLSWEDMTKGLVGVGVLLAEVGVFLNTAKFSAKSMLTATGIVILAAAIKVLASAAKDFAGMSWGEIVKGLTSIGLLLAEITAFTKLTGNAKHVVSTGLALIEIAAAMKIFASAMKDFGNMSWSEIAKGLTAMGGALAEVAIATRLMPKNMVGIGTGLVIVGASLKIIASALGSMGSMSWEEIAKGLVAMGGALAELSIALNLMNGTLKGSAALLVAAGALAVLTPVLKTLGNMSWESIAKGLITIAGAFTIIGIAGAVLGPLVPAILGLSAALAIIGVSAVAIGAGLVLIGTGLTAVSVGLTSLATALAASAAAIVAGLSAIILGIAALIPAIAEKIGEAIIAFCGIIANGAPAIAEAVKAVVLSLVDMLVTCVPAIADGALQLVAGVLAALVAYTPQIIDSIMQFLIEILEGIARNMPQLIQAAMDVVGSFFSGILSALGNIDVDTLIKGLGAVGLLTGIVAALGAISALIPAAMVGVLGLGVVVTELALVLAAVGGLAQIPGLEWLISEGGSLLQTIGTAIGGFVGGIVGGFMSGVSSSFPQIGADLSAFMTNAQPFIDGASNISPDLLTGIANLTGAILLITAADLLEGLTSWLTGGSSLADFGAELVPFGESMVAFSNSISGLDAELVSKAATAGKTLAEMAATLPNSGGVIGFFTGNNDMAAFGKELVVFGAAMVAFGLSVKGLDTDAVQNAAIAGKAMAEMASTLPNTGGAVAFFAGDNDMTTFGEQLVPFGTAMKEYSDAVAGLDVDAVVNSATAGQALVELANTVPNTGGAVAFFTGDNDLGTFGEQIVSFGEAMRSYSEAVSGINQDAVANSATAGAALVELANTVPNTGGVVSFFTGDNDLSSFGDSIVSFGEAMKNYSESVAGIDSDAVTSSATAALALAELQNSLPNVGGIVEFFTGGNDLSKFAEGLIPFGEAMKTYGASVAGINSSAITASATAAQSLAELQSSLPNVGGVMEFFTGGNDLGKFAEGIVPFGEAMKSYGSSVAGINTEAISSSAIAAKSLAELQAILPNVGGVMEFFSGGSNFSAFSEGIVDFGKAMQEYAEVVSGINVNAINASTSLGSSLAELAQTLPRISETTVANVEDMMTDLSGIVANNASEINDTVTTMVSDVSKTVRTGVDPTKSAVQAVATAALNAITSYRDKFHTAGQNVGDGFIQGIRSRVSLATNAGYELGRAALDAAKRALDSHSPSKEFIYLGENMGEGLAIGARNSIVPAAEATSDMIGEVLDAASGELKSWENWLSEKKYYNKISLKDELAGWEKLQQKYAEGSEERIKIDREVYRVQNELVESTYQASLDWIEREKYYNRLSTEEELAAYERMQKRYIEGSEQRMAIDRKVYELRNQLVNDSYENSMNWIEEEKYYNRMSLADELAAYKRVQSRYAKGTEERKKMDREVYRVEQEIYEAQKQYIEDVQHVQTEANQQKLDLEQEYADKVKSINNQLANDIKNLNDQYENALSSRTNSLYSAYGLFDEVKEREEVSGSKLLDNLQGQVEEFGEWQRTLDKLSARGVDSELIAELSQMGPKAISQIKALESMSDSELNRYVGLWQVKHAQARQQAVGELEGLRKETERNIVQLRVDAEQELEEYRITWQQKMNQIDIDANAELDQLRRDFAEKVGLIKKDTETETQEMVDAAQKILEEAGWDETGHQIVAGIRQGIEDEKPSFLDTLTQMALDGVEAVKETLDINSPSRVFRQLGNYTGLGFVKGLAEYAKESYDAGSSVAENAKDGLGNAMHTVTDYLNGDLDMRPTIRPVLDLSDVANSAGVIDGLLYNQKLMALASQTSFAFAANTGESELTVNVDNNSVVNELRSLRGEMAEMAERMAHLQVVLDSGTLVGETAPLMDSALGQRQTFRGRGN